MDSMIASLSLIAEAFYSAGGKELMQISIRQFVPSKDGLNGCNYRLHVI